MDGLAPKCQRLLRMKPVVAAALRGGTPTGGVYLFSEGNTHLYAGRTKRAIGVRIRNQFGRNVSAASFPSLIAREVTGRRRAAYTRGAGTRAELLADPEFGAALDNARTRISAMLVRYVQEVDPLRQALLEIYVAVVTNARYNDFDTH